MQRLSNPPERIDPMSSRSVKVISLAFMMNNAIWLSAWYYHLPEPVEYSKASITTLSPAAAECHQMQADPAPESVARIQPEKPVSKEQVEIANLIEQPSIFDPDEADLDMLEELQSNFEFERQAGMALFFATDNDKKLETLEMLSTQGDDLKFLREVLKTEGDEEVKKAVLQKFHQQHSYEANNLLLEALDDSSLDVALTALHLIASNGDRSLIPILRNKMEVLPNGAARDFYTRSISRLETTSAMDMEE